MSEQTMNREDELLTLMGDQAISPILNKILEKHDANVYTINKLLERLKAFLLPTSTQEERLNILIRSSVELTSSQEPEWEFIASYLLRYRMQIRLNKHQAYGSFYEKLEELTSKGLYGSYMLENYSKEDLDELEAYLDDERDDLLNYSALNLLEKRYLVRDWDGNVLETPQEMFMGIAMHLAIPEGDKRVYWACKFYDILSRLQVTMATPTMSNARKPHHQLSSCFIDTVDDSLKGIYKSIDNFAQVSKSGGGMGLYFGKVRANGSDIRGFKGIAGGVNGWIKLANDTAVTVDQLGVRQGSCAVYLDAWHRDLPEFLQLRTNNGDDRIKAHDIFPAVCFPDLFWKLAKEDLNNSWYLMCPHEILASKGYSLEDAYGQEWEEKYYDCIKDSSIPKREITIKDIVRLMIKSVSETGTPFVFNRDTVNRMNPNGHKGMIYSSNLCTEIMQNMSAMKINEPTVQKDEFGHAIVRESIEAGDFVVCNLASLVLGHLPIKDKDALEGIVATVVRALDNVIELNAYPVPYAAITNSNYRSLGLGTSGYHHLLAKEGITWESQAHLDFVDHLYEDINYAAIKASQALSEEKGAYPYFEGSDWQNGTYFKKRGYTSKRWEELAQKVEKGIRNAYLLAVAPTGSTSIIAGSTAAIDPVMEKFFLEEKKGDLLPRVAPDLSEKTFWYYKAAHVIDQNWSIKACGVRQRHIDQAQSFNLYITTEHSMRQILDYYISAWEQGVKTVYYVRSKSLEIKDCESCSA